MRISIGGKIGPIRASIPLVSGRELRNLGKAGRGFGPLIIIMLPFALVIVALSYVVSVIIGVSYESVVPYVTAIIFVPIIGGLFGAALYLFYRTGRVIWTTRGALVEPIAIRWPILKVPTTLLVNATLLFVPFLVVVFSVAGIISWVTGYAVSTIAPILIRSTAAALVLRGAISGYRKLRSRQSDPVATPHQGAPSVEN